MQIKVKVEKPDDHLRPEMNASVAFLSDDKPAPAGSAPSKPVVMVPDGRAIRRAVKTGVVSNQSVRIDEGLIGGEDVIVAAPAGLKDGDKVRTKA